MPSRDVFLRTSNSECVSHQQPATNCQFFSTESCTSFQRTRCLHYLSFSNDQLSRWCLLATGAGPHSITSVFPPSSSSSSSSSISITQFSTHVFTTQASTHLILGFVHWSQQPARVACEVSWEPRESDPFPRSTVFFASPACLRQALYFFLI